MRVKANGKEPPAPPAKPAPAKPARPRAARRPAKPKAAQPTVTVVPPTLAEAMPENERRLIETLFSARDDHEVYLFRQQYREDFRALFPLWPEVMRLPHDDPQAREFHEKAGTLVELYLARRVWAGGMALTALMREAGKGSVLPVAPSRVCACVSPGDHDRKCLQCGWKLCPKCQPASGGAPCRRCRGPVWGDGEARSAPIRNPKRRGY